MTYKCERWGVTGLGSFIVDLGEDIQYVRITHNNKSWESAPKASTITLDTHIYL
jgi:hypothetical protein